MVDWVTTSPVHRDPTIVDFAQHLGRQLQAYLPTFHSGGDGISGQGFAALGHAGSDCLFRRNRELGTPLCRILHW